MSDSIMTLTGDICRSISAQQNGFLTFWLHGWQS